MARTLASFRSATLPAFALLATLVAVPTSTAHAGGLSAGAPHRMRLGLETGVGAVLGDSAGAAFQLDLQLGYQAGDIVSIYYQTALMVEGWASNNTSVSGFAFFPQLAMIDFTFGRLFQIGAGGGVDIGQFATCDASGAACTTTSRQTNPALAARLALIIPLPGARARWGIPIAVQFHESFLSNSQKIHSLVLTVGFLRF